MLTFSNWYCVLVKPITKLRLKVVKWRCDFTERYPAHFLCTKRSQNIAFSLCENVRPYLVDRMAHVIGRHLYYPWNTNRLDCHRVLKLTVSALICPSIPSLLTFVVSRLCGKQISMLRRSILCAMKNEHVCVLRFSFLLHYTHISSRFLWLIYPFLSGGIVDLGIVIRLPKCRQRNLEW